MIGKLAYTYTLLRYIHDPFTGEFVNVGVVLHSRKGNFLGSVFNHRVSRLTHLFPDFNKKSYRSNIGFFERRCAKLSKELVEQLDLEQSKDAGSIACSILPNDDSAFQWSNIKSGISDDLEATLQHLFDRLVKKYDEIPAQRKKTDDDVWRHFRSELAERQILKHFKPKTIRSPSNDVLKIDHAWENGIWHCIEPLSFDLSDPDPLREKAYRWFGHLANIQDTTESFRLYFLLGEPENEELKPAFHKAVNILEKIPIDKELFFETDVDELSDKLEDQIKASRQN